MPANLPPEYFEVEKRYKQSQGSAEKLAALEELIASVPKHKGTDKLRADLRARLSKLREESVRKKKGGKADPYTVDRQGALQIALVGFPNSGKSSLLKGLTNANPAIADYPVTTVMPLSGMMPFEDIQFQLVDLPPIGNESTDGWVSGILRNADLFMLIVDLADDPEVQAELLLEQLASWRIPHTTQTAPKAKDSTTAGRRVVVAGNKLDLQGSQEGLNRLKMQFGGRLPITGVSAEKKTNLDDLKRMVFEASGIIRVYTKEPGREPDLGTPFAVKAGSTVLDLAEIIHKEFVKNLKYVCIWGSARFLGQKVQRDYVPRDRDIIEFHI